MTSWIEYAQHFVISDFIDNAAWDAAQSACQDNQIRIFLKYWPVKSEEEVTQADLLAKSLEVDKQEVAALMVRFLTYFPNLLALQRPLQIPLEQREPLLDSVRAFINQIGHHRELLPISGFLNFICGSALYMLKDYPAARIACEKSCSNYRELAKERKALYLPNVAMALNCLGIVQRGLHNYTLARGSLKESHDIYHQLITSQPTLYLNHVCVVLNNLGVLLRDMSDFPAARTAYEKALKISRPLAAEQPAIYQPHVASTLNNLGNLLRDICDFSAARMAFDEALEIRRQFAAEKPEVYLLDVTGTLNNLGMLLHAVHDFPAARAAFEEALEIRYQLALEQPTVYLPDVAETANNLGNLLRDEHDFSSARTFFEGARDIHQQLAVEQPATYRPDMAITLNNLGNILRDMHDFPASRTAIEEALRIMRQLAAEQPTVYLSDLAMTLINLGNLLSDMCDFLAAQTAFGEARDLYCQLAIDQPSVHRKNKAAILNNLGTPLCMLRDFQAARAAYEEALEIRRQLASEQPTAYLPDVAETLTNFGAFLRDVRDFSAAITASEKARDIYVQLATEQPTIYLHDVAITLTNLSALLCDVHDFPEAHRQCVVALEIWRRFASAQPPTYRPNLAMTLNILGQVMRDMGDFPAARTAYEDSLETNRQLAKDQPTAYLSDVAVNLNNLGMLLRDVGDFAAARTAYEEALDIQRQLAKDQPVIYLPVVAGTLNNLGFLLRDGAAFPAAHRAFEEAVKLIELMDLPGSSRHLVKNNATIAYRSLLAEAVATGANDKAFAYSVAMRDGQARSGSIGLNELQATQEWLNQQTKQYGMSYRLLVANRGSGEQLVLGLIDQVECRFICQQSEAWMALFSDDKEIEDNEPRRQLARELWQSLPDAFQAALTPMQANKPFIMISGDPLWSAFPWELLRFGDGEEDYLGLYHALPRLGAIQAKDLELQLNPCGLGQGGGQMTILAPYDAVPTQILWSVPNEIKLVSQAVENRGGRVVASASGKEASDLELVRQIRLQPDIFYYSGHGAIVREEELLVLHRDKSERHALTPFTYFGKEHLMGLAKNMTKNNGQLFSHHPLIVLNSCVTGRGRQAGGAREDLTSTLLTLGAGAVIAAAVPIYESTGVAIGEALFDPSIASTSDIGSVIVGVRRRLAREVHDDVESLYWGEWALIHLHGNARATLPFKQPPVTP